MTDKTFGTMNVCSRIPPPGFGCPDLQDETKRQTNLTKHGIDLAEAGAVFDAPMLTDEDAREAYGEQRLKSLYWLDGRVAVLVWADRKTGYDDKHETIRYF